VAHLFLADNFTGTRPFRLAGTGLSGDEKDQLNKADQVIYTSDKNPKP
jgi:hypothetical protein